MPEDARRTVRPVPASRVVLSFGAAVLLLAAGVAARSGEAHPSWPAQGERLFHRVWTMHNGAGPLANAQSCVACHAHPRAGGGGPGSLVMVSPEATDPTGGHLFRQFLFRPGKAVVRQPLPNRVFHRRPPSLLGLGVLEGVPAGSLAALADPDDRDADGVSGRVAAGAGRFGWKARFARLEEAVAAALVGELGVTNPTFAERGAPAPEVSAAELRALTAFVRTLAPPSRAHALSGGRAEFTAFGCATCHVPQLPGVTDPDGSPREAFTDLLLHDMGPALADLREGSAAASEFRTPPLWGINAMAGAFMHDGRAPTLDAAIRAHGGEADASRRRYEQAPARQRAALLRFLSSR